MSFVNFTNQQNQHRLLQESQGNYKNSHLNFKQQSNFKRENLRLQIRRKAVEHYQKRVRNQMNLGLQFQNSSQALNNHQTINFQPQLTSPVKQKDWNQFQFESHPGGQFSQTLEYLQEMELTHASELCTKSSLIYLRNLTKQKLIGEVWEKIDRILLKISINQLYWDEQFLCSFIQLLSEISCCHKGQIGVYQYLANLSQCNILEFKIIIYNLAMKSDLLHGQISAPSIGLTKARTGKSKILSIISNLLLIPPVVSHAHQDLYKQIYSTENYISRLMFILLNLTQIETQSSEKSTKKSNYDQYHLLQVLYGLCTRLECSEIELIVSWFHKNNKYSMLLSLIQKYSQITHSNLSLDETGKTVFNGSNNGVIEIKQKHKLLQITQTILQFCISKQEYHRVGLQFIYNLLPQILGIVVADINYFVSKSTQQGNPRSQKNKLKYFYSPIQDKYEILLLQVLYTLLNIRDQQNGLPALDYIQARYPSLLQDISEHYCLSNVESKKAKIAIWIHEIILTSIPRCCQINWISKFICSFLSSLDLADLKNDMLLSVLESTVYILNNHQDQYHPCLLVAEFSESRILKKLEDLALQISTSQNQNKVCDEIVKNIDNILSLINHQSSSI